MSAGTHSGGGVYYPTTTGGHVTTIASSGVTITGATFMSSLDEDTPTVMLCGARQFKATFDQLTTELTKVGVIVHSSGVWSMLSVEERRLVRELQRRKIDLSDLVLAVNVNDTYDHETLNELMYAHSRGKQIVYLEKPEHDPPWE
jgi:hypothetical protein